MRPTRQLRPALCRRGMHELTWRSHRHPTSITRTADHLFNLATRRDTALTRPPGMATDEEAGTGRRTSADGAQRASILLGWHGDELVRPVPVAVRRGRDSRGHAHADQQPGRTGGAHGSPRRNRSGGASGPWTEGSSGGLGGELAHVNQVRSGRLGDPGRSDRTPPPGSPGRRRRRTCRPRTSSA